ncbi:MAG: PfkB family carbohydrate kinase, partial [Natronospirillum sp.]
MWTKPQHDKTPPIVWSIAGSDSGGGAGIQADIATIHALGGHAATAITAVTAQNSVGVQAIESVSEALFSAQLQSLAEDLTPSAIKIGLLSNAWQIAQLREQLPRWRQQWPHLTVVLDPVLVATSGDRLADDTVVDALLELLPWVDVVTPNLPELRSLTGQPCVSESAAIAAARHLLARGCTQVLVKGGH